jgi:hypothetical protein
MRPAAASCSHADYEALSYRREDLLPKETARRTPANLQRTTQRAMRPEQLTIQRTATGYWTVQRGAIHVAGSMTREGAEAERELLRRLSRRSVKRARGRVAARA